MKLYIIPFLNFFIFLLTLYVFLCSKFKINFLFLKLEKIIYFINFLLCIIFGFEILKDINNPDVIDAINNIFIFLILIIYIILSFYFFIKIFIKR